MRKNVLRKNFWKKIKIFKFSFNFFFPFVRELEMPTSNSKEHFWDSKKCLIKLRCNNKCVFRASWAKPRLFSITKVKKMQCIAFLLEIFLFKTEIACDKKLINQDVITRLKTVNVTSRSYDQWSHYKWLRVKKSPSNLIIWLLLS
jgi:hypothetical protein